jgi:serine/threonine protein kinase
MPYLTCLAPRGRCIPLKHADVVLCLHNMLACLRKLHEREIVHMDIKPSHLFVRYADSANTTSAKDDDGDHAKTIAEFLLADFGLSRVCPPITLQMAESLTDTWLCRSLEVGCASLWALVISCPLKSLR